MRSVAIKDVKSLEVKELQEPVADGNKVIIEITKSGICGSDIHNWDSGNPKGLVMGHEFCGKVIDAGSRDDLKVGDRVTALPISPCGKCPACLSGNVQYCPVTWQEAVGLSINNPGGLTEKIAVRPDMVLKVDDRITDDEVAMVEPTAVGLHAIHLADIKVGSKVLIVGGGIIGLVSAMFAKKEGASYVALTETNPARGKKAVKLGVVDEWFDAKENTTTETLMQKTNGGFDIVIECCGNSPAVNSSFMLVKPGGRVVLVGVSAEPISTYTVMAVMKELTVLGAIAYTVEEFKTCIDIISNKQIEVDKFIDDIVGFEDVQKSYERLTSGNDDAIKILVDPNK